MILNDLNKYLVIFSMVHVTRRSQLPMMYILDQPTIGANSCVEKLRL